MNEKIKAYNIDSKEQVSRSLLLIGDEAQERIAKASVAVFGLGGVGGYAVEALARAGVGHLILVDNDTVSVSNINRQLIATYATIGISKAKLWRERVLCINPLCTVDTHEVFVTLDSAADFDFAAYDACIDAVDTVSAKLGLVREACKAGTYIISAMGAGNRLSARGFTVGDIFDTSYDKIAKVMRHELRQMNITKLDVVYSTEQAKRPNRDKGADNEPTDGTEHRRISPGSMSYVPGISGLMLAGEVINRLINTKG